MRLVHYLDSPVALVTAGHARLVPWVEQLDTHDPAKRFVCAMCLFAMEHEAGTLAGRFSQLRAERFAREALMPADEFAPLADIADADLAELFGVPSEEVRLRRHELRGKPHAPRHGTAAHAPRAADTAAPPAGGSRTQDRTTAERSADNDHISSRGETDD